MAADALPLRAKPQSFSTGEVNCDPKAQNKLAVCLTNKSTKSAAFFCCWHVFSFNYMPVTQMPWTSLYGKVGAVTLYSLGVLVDLHWAVESFQLSHQELQVGVNIAQLQQHHFFHLVVRWSPGEIGERKQRNKKWNINIKRETKNIWNKATGSETSPLSLSTVS